MSDSDFTENAYLNSIQVVRELGIQCTMTAIWLNAILSAVAAMGPGHPIYFVVGFVFAALSAMTTYITAQVSILITQGALTLSVRRWATLSALPLIFMLASLIIWVAGILTL